MPKHFAVQPDGQVFVFSSAAAAVRAAASIPGAILATDDAETGLKDIPTPLLITLYNIIRPERPITRFSDRKTAEVRMKGVLEALARPGVVPADAPETPDDAPRSTEEETTMATKTARKRTTTKTTGAKTARTNKPAEISEATVRKVIKARAEGNSWPEVLKALGDGTTTFIFRVRALMKKMDRKSVRLSGPGSPSYGKSKKSK